jgi:hypothetical protein
MDVEDVAAVRSTVTERGPVEDEAVEVTPVRHPTHPVLQAFLDEVETSTTRART